MLFNSFAYAIYLPAVFIMYYLLPSKYRNTMLLIASYYFYMSWNVKLIVLILTTTVISYLGAKFIHKGKSPKIFLLLSIATCVGILLFFKYFNFFSLTITDILRSISLPVPEFTLDLLLPVGISFYTFQTLSYVIDVYKKKIEPESKFFTYALYISFFPQLVAGPIERPENLIPQFKTKHVFDYEKAVYGAKQIAWGAFKKVVIADTLAQYVNLVYNHLPDHKGFSIILATFFFAIQIYCDFSGYTDIAIGSARLLGFDLMQNFNVPYLATSIKDFWARWHISLSSWFKDYVYIPLGGSRVSPWKCYRNLLVTFLLSGLWHGASLTFVAWGLYHGALNCIQTFVKKHFKNFKAPKAISICVTFCLVCGGWILFRMNNINDIFYIVRYTFHGITSPFNYLWQGLSDLGLAGLSGIYITLPILLLVVVEVINYKSDVLSLVKKLPVCIKWVLYWVLTYVVVIFFIYQVNLNVAQDFMYFQF